MDKEQVEKEVTDSIVHFLSIIILALVYTFFIKASVLILAGPIPALEPYCFTYWEWFILYVGCNIVKNIVAGFFSKAKGEE